MHGDSTGQRDGTNVEENKTSGGGIVRPVRHKTPLGILIFLVKLKVKMSNLSIFLLI